MTLDADLAGDLASPGYTPRRRDVPRLLSALADADDDVAKRIERALSRVGKDLLGAVESRFSSLAPKARASAVAALGRVLDSTPEPSVRAFIVARLADADARVMRRAITALGKTAATDLEAPLLGVLKPELPPPELRALVVALGNVGQSASLAALENIVPANPELARVLAEARRKIERRASRDAPGVVLGDVVPRIPVMLLLHVRAGLESLLVTELPQAMEPEIVGAGRVRIRLSTSLRSVFEARTFLHVGFPLKEVRAEASKVPEAVAAALASAEAMAVFSTFSPDGPIRYRLEWSDGGRRRGATAVVAERVGRAEPRLSNDPVRAPWEAVVAERPHAGGIRVFVELWPRGFSDPRFSYRKQTLPASSHPTIAAALVRLASPDSGDTLWDPFVGSGMELCEASLAAPGVRLVGSDRDAGALSAAKENLAAVGARNVTLVEADAREFSPPHAPTLIVTNPPFGRRVRGEGDNETLLVDFCVHAARVLAPGGRLVWISPHAERTAAALVQSGLTLIDRFPVDVGGITAEVQIAEKPPDVPLREKISKRR